MTCLYRSIYPRWYIPWPIPLAEVCGTLWPHMSRLWLKKTPEARCSMKSGLRGCLRLLKMHKAPTMLGLIVGYLYLSMPDGTFAEPKYYHAEAFAGAKRVTQAFLDAGLPAVAMDSKYGAEWDLNSDIGFVNTLKHLLQTSTASTLAPVCSSFTHMNSGTARRTFATPLGNMHQPSVRYANKLGNRCILLLHLLFSLGILFILEQPKNSFLEQLPRFQEFIKSRKIHRKLIYMKDSLHGLSLNFLKWQWQCTYTATSCICHLYIQRDTYIH